MIYVTLSCVLFIMFELGILLVSMVRPQSNALKYEHYPHFTEQEAEAQGVETSCKKSYGY